jgi:hypothetical protein
MGSFRAMNAFSSSAEMTQHHDLSNGFQSCLYCCVIPKNTTNSSPVSREMEASQMQMLSSPSCGSLNVDFQGIRRENSRNGKSTRKALA